MFENVGLYRSAQRHYLVGIQLYVWSASEKVLYCAANERRACGAADENDFVDFLGLQLAVGERQFDRAYGAIDNRVDQGVESTTSKFLCEHFPIGQRKFERHRFFFGEVVLDCDQRFTKLLRDFAVRRKIDFVSLQNFLVNEGLQKIVNIIAAEVGIAIGGKNLIDVAFVSGN